MTFDQVRRVWSRTRWRVACCKPSVIEKQNLAYDGGAQLDLLMRALGWHSGLQCTPDSGHVFVEACGFALEMPVDTLQLCRANVKPV